MAFSETFVGWCWNVFLKWRSTKILYVPYLLKYFKKGSSSKRMGFHNLLHVSRNRHVINLTKKSVLCTTNFFVVLFLATPFLTPTRLLEATVFCLRCRRPPSSSKLNLFSEWQSVLHFVVLNYTFFSWIHICKRFDGKFVNDDGCDFRVW